MRNTVSMSLFVQKADDWRASLGLNHGQFAKRYGMSQGQWSKIRTGQRRLTARTAGRLLKDNPSLRPYWLAEVLSETDAA